MKWFIRWLIVAIVLIGLIIVIWWFFFVDWRPDQFWETLIYAGIGSILISGLMAMGATDSLEEADEVFPYSSFKSAAIKGVDIDRHLKQRLLVAAEAAPAIWAFVVVGMVVILVGVSVKFVS